MDKDTCYVCKLETSKEDVIKLVCSCQRVHKDCLECLVDREKDLYHAGFCVAENQCCYKYYLSSHFCKNCGFFLQNTLLDIISLECETTYNDKSFYIRNMSCAQEYFQIKLESGAYKTQEDSFS